MSAQKNSYKIFGNYCLIAANTSSDKGETEGEKKWVSTPSLLITYLLKFQTGALLHHPFLAASDSH
jgi:hypothetical protein